MFWSINQDMGRSVIRQQPEWQRGTISTYRQGLWRNFNTLLFFLLIKEDLVFS
jgi:hypothetical protein